MPLLSVVMPVFNQEKYVASAIQSILNQTFTDFEFLIVDDGSTDKTVKIIQGFNDNRICLIQSEHKGFLSALELGVNSSKGKWVARMDSDDISHPERLEKQLEFLNNHPECCFVASSYGIITPNGHFLSPKHSMKWYYLNPNDISYAKYLFADPSAIFHREKALSVGYDVNWENEKPLWYKLLSLGKGVVLEQPYHYIRYIWGSHSRSNFNKRFEANQKIRLKYDPKFDETFPNSQKNLNKKLAIRAATKCINFYLAADDFSAAKKVTLNIFYQHPFNITVWKLLIRSFGKVNSDIKSAMKKSKFAFSKIESLW